MNRLIFFLFAFLLFSCGDDDETIKFLDEGLEDINFNNSNYSMLLQGYLDEATELNPREYAKHREDGVKISKKRDELIEQLEKLMRKDTSISLTKTVNIFGEERRLIDKLYNEYEQTLLSAVENDSIKAEIEETLKFKNIKKEYFTYAELNILMNKIHLSELYAIKYLKSKINIRSLNFNKILPVVKQNKSVFRKGEMLEADISVVISYTSYNDYKVIINKDTFYPENGMVNYRRKADKLGIHKIKGKHIMLNPATNDTVEYPFSTSYNVVK